MSVTISWRPAGKNEWQFSCGTSDDLAALEGIFGKRIGLGDLPVLRGMCRVSGNKAFYAEVIAVVEQHECIEIWGSW